MCGRGQRSRESHAPDPVDCRRDPARCTPWPCPYQRARGQRLGTCRCACGHYLGKRRMVVDGVALQLHLALNSIRPWEVMATSDQDRLEQRESQHQTTQCRRQP